MSEYKLAKPGKFRFKGDKSSHKKHKSKKRKHEEECNAGSSKDEDCMKHGGWWKATKMGDITGSVAVQFGQTPIYIKALNQGLFTVGAPHDEGEGPDPEEILTAVPAGGTNQIAFKSGYGKYLSVDSKGRVTGVSDAIGAREQWEPIFQDGKTALLGPNDCFLGIDDEDNVIAMSPKASDEEMVFIRCNHDRGTEKSDSVEVDKGKLKEVELHYVKMFQKFQDKKTKVNSDGRMDLKDARNQGKLHESLLDRRSKMKADRYCK